MTIATKVSNEEAARNLRTAAAIMRERGFCQGDFMRGRAVCMSESIVRAITGHSGSSPAWQHIVSVEDRKMIDERPEVRVVLAQIGSTHVSGATGICEFNNRSTTTEDMAVETMEAAANRLEQLIAA